MPDELTKSPGLSAPQLKSSLPSPRVLIGLAAAALLAGGAVALRDIPAPEPFAVAPIEISPADIPREENSPPPRSSVRAEARPAAAGGAAWLSPVPDPRLVERTPYGILPRVGPDGARPAEVYARPAAATDGRPRIALLVGGLGVSQSLTADAVATLPPEITLAFAPYGADLERAVAQARERGHEVMLQVPMEPFDYPDNDPGPHTLLARAEPHENLERLRWIMGRVTGYVGLVNFMGAKLTANPTALTPILAETASRGLIFLDDGSSHRSAVAGDGTVRAGFAIEGRAGPDGIDRALAAVERAARERGIAIATAEVGALALERIGPWARALQSKGIALVPVSSAYAGHSRP
jgi:polysaccharide deacetylase 2 family uncharacterized protein YibQ